MGSAPCLLDDLQQAGSWGDLMAINDAGVMVANSISFWATYHPEDFMSRKNWIERRRNMGGNMNFRIISDRPHGGLVDLVFGGPSKTGSSTLYGVMAGIALGYSEIIVAGAPLSTVAYRIFRLGWEDVADKLRGRVRSMSGWTKTFLETL